MIEFPLGWKSVALSDLTSPERSTVRAYDSARPYLGLEHVGAGSTKVVGTGDSRAIKSAVKPFASGYTLYARLRPYLNKVCAPEFEGVASAEFLAFAPRPWLAPRYLLYLFNSPTFVAFANHNAEGIERPRISWPRIGAFPTALPPLDEQRRIVVAIEEHLSRLDAANASLVAAQQRRRVLRSLVLEAAFMLDAPRKEVGSLARVGSGATPKRGRPEYWDGGTIPWVTSGQLNDEYVREAADFITEQALRETNVKLWPPGTLLVALYGEGQTRGRCAELAFEATTNQACAAVVFDENLVDRTYARRFFDATYAENRRLASGGVQPNLSLGLIRSRRIPLPPLDEQRRIVQEVEERLSTIDATRASIERAQRRSAALRAAILERAFRGELVPQDPSDEPASVLLDRSRAERDFADVTPRRRSVRA